MNLFIAIHQEDRTPEVDVRVESHFPGDSFRISDRVLLIRSLHDHPGLIASKIGLSEEAHGVPNIGVVFNLTGSYSGFYDEELWDWLVKTRERALAEW